MVFLTPKALWLLAGLAAAYVAGHTLLVARPRRAATVARLTTLDSCLAVASRQRAQGARGTLAGLQQTVAKTRYQKLDVAVLRQAQRLQATTQALADTVRRLRQHWPAHRTPAAVARLAAQVRQFTDTLGVYLPPADALGELLPTRTQPGWPGGLDLASASTPAALAVLARLETQVCRIGNEALIGQAAKVQHCWVFERIGAAAVPASNTVAPGARYEARLMLTSTGPGRLTMQADGRSIAVDPRTNQGTVAFQVPPARPGQPDTVRASWRGVVHTSFNGLTDTAFAVTVPYLIVKRPQL